MKGSLRAVLARGPLRSLYPPLRTSQVCPYPEAEAGIADGSYRHEMCRSPATRRAWPLLRRMITSSPYRDRLDQIFDQLDRETSLS